MKSYPRRSRAPVVRYEPTWTYTIKYVIATDSTECIIHTLVVLCNALLFSLVVCIILRGKEV